MLKDAEKSILLKKFKVTFNTLLYLMGEITLSMPMWELNANNIFSFQILRIKRVKYR